MVTNAEVYELALPVGTDQRTAGHLPGTEELVMCVTGRLRVGPVGEEVVLCWRSRMPSAER